jgi:hypothetical protein
MCKAETRDPVSPMHANTIAIATHTAASKLLRSKFSRGHPSKLSLFYVHHRASFDSTWNAVHSDPVWEKIIVWISMN